MNIQTFLRSKWALGLILIVVLAGFFVGRWTAMPLENHESHAEHSENHSEYTCSMHPQVRKYKPGKCPICFMDLVPVESDMSEKTGERKIKYWVAPMDPSYKRDKPGKSPMGMDLVPVYEESDTGSVRQIKLSAQARALANIQTAMVKRDYATKTIPLVGKIDVDETQLSTITSRFPGRIDKLFINYTGVEVKQGDHMAEIYSPELLVAQKELLAAKQSGNQTLIQSSREKLRLWNIPEWQIKRVERGKSLSDHFTLTAPLSGIVVKKEVVEGNYVKTGSTIFSIANLSKLWLLLEAYEQDMLHIKYGQEVTFSTPGIPGQTFKGKISFVSPVIDPMTRTVKVRVNVSNKEGFLKPGLLVEAEVKSRLDAKGNYMDRSLAGKWISPMHPEVVSNKPGKCTVCGMGLVKAESLGIVSKKKRSKPLLIPASAPLLTGKRSVVYVQDPDNQGLFEGREVVLGPRVGNAYIVHKGLAEGERVVTKGNFKIDSAMQISAKPSMMNPAESKKHVHKSNTKKSHASKRKATLPKPFLSQVESSVMNYLDIQKALAKDNLKQAKSSLASLEKSLKAVDMNGLDHQTQPIWMQQTKALNHSIQDLNKSHSMAAFRQNFQALSKAMEPVVSQFATGIKQDLNLAYCPMAFDNKGGSWIQEGLNINNPYFGASMLRCGEIKKDLKKK